MPRSPRLLLALGLVLAALAAVAPVLAAPRKLNPTLALGGQIQPIERPPLRPGYQLSPNGARVFFLADRATAGVVELFGAPVDGGAPIRLSAPLVPGGNVVEFAVDSAASRVVYLADQREDESFELFSVPVAGGAPVSLNSFLVPGGDVTAFALSPDASTVVFRADRNDDEQFDLFGAPIGGGAPDVRLNNRAGPAGDVQPDFAITGDNQRVIFRSDERSAGVFGLWSAPLTGGAPADDITVGTLGAPGGPSVLDFVLSPGGSRVVFRFSEPVSGSLNLGLSPAAGPVFFLNNLTAFAAGSAVEAPGPAEVPDGREGPEPPPYAVTPDGAAVILLADGVDGRYELWRAPMNDGPGFVEPTSLTPALGADADVAAFAVSPDSTRVVFKADNAFRDDQLALSAVNMDGTGATLLAVPEAPEGDLLDFALSPDGGRAVFRADFSRDGQVELGSVPLDGSAAPARLSGELGPNGDVGRFVLTPSGQRVIFSADRDLDGVVELFGVLLAGGAPTRLSPPMATGGNVEDFAVGAGALGGLVVFRADPVADAVFHLLGVPAAGGPAVTLSGSAAISGDVVDHQLTADAAYVVYRADQEADERFELWGRRLEGDEPPIRLNGPLPTGGDVTSFALDATGTFVVYLADQEADGVQELFSAPVAGGGSIRLNPPLPPGGQVLDFRLSADGARVVYRASEGGAGRLELFGVPIRGGAAVSLSGSVDGLGPRQYELSPDSRRVVYLAGGDKDGGDTLYSVSLLGGSPTRLNAALPEGGGVATFAVSPDSARVVYIADQNRAEVFELYSVALTGGAPVRLSPPLPPGRNVGLGAGCAGQRADGVGGGLAVLVSPDGARVVYCADQDADEVLELYSAPITGERAAVKLNLPPGAGGAIGGFAISGDSAWVVFESVSVVAGVPQERLYSALIGGERPPVPLSGPLRSGSEVARFVISPDNGSVVFTAGRAGDAPVELYISSVGSGAPVRRSGELVDGGNVGEFRFTPDGGALIYRADASADEVFELFAVALRDGSEPVRLSDPPVPGGDVYADFAIDPGGERVIYRADQLIDNVDELFEARLGPGGGPNRVYLPTLRR